MFVEIHMLQNFAPSCLNRNESNSPKDCSFGGYRRARISSQCIKNAMRTQVFPKLLDESNRAIRLLNLKVKIADILVSEKKDADVSKQVAENLITLIGLGIDKKKTDNTKVLLFLGNQEIVEMAHLCQDNWDLLLIDKPNKDQKKQLDSIKKIALAKLDGQKAADLALFGRMVAEIPSKRIDAAAQVAHAISTNRVSQEFDFFTAINEGQKEDVQGAGMMGTIEFNSACYYRYANVDVDQLLENLQDDKELTKKTIEAFLTASIKAIPTGKMTSMAAQNPPSFVFITLRNDDLWSLSNAFVKPISQERGNLIEDSVSVLTKYWDCMVTTYGDDDIIAKALFSQGGNLNGLEDANKSSMQATITEIISAIKL